MGRKVHPIGFRLGIHRKWKSNWYFDSKNYTKFLHLNFDIEKFFKGVLYFYPIKTILVNCQLIKLSSNHIYIFIFYYRLRKKNKRIYYNFRKIIKWKSNLKKFLYKKNLEQFYKKSLNISNQKNIWNNLLPKKQSKKIFIKNLSLQNETNLNLKACFLNLKKIIKIKKLTRNINKDFIYFLNKYKINIFFQKLKIINKLNQFNFKQSIIFNFYFNKCNKVLLKTQNLFNHKYFLNKKKIIKIFKLKKKFFKKNIKLFYKYLKKFIKIFSLKQQKTLLKKNFKIQNKYLIILLNFDKNISLNKNFFKIKYFNIFMKVFYFYKKPKLYYKIKSLLNYNKKKNFYLNFKLNLLKKKIITQKINFNCINKEYKKISKLDKKNFLKLKTPKLSFKNRKKFLQPKKKRYLFKILKLKKNFKFSFLNLKKFISYFTNCKINIIFINILSFYKFFYFIQKKKKIKKLIKLKHIIYENYKNLFLIKINILRFILKIL